MIPSAPLAMVVAAFPSRKMNVTVSQQGLLASVLKRLAMAVVLFAPVPSFAQDASQVYFYPFEECFVSETGEVHCVQNSISGATTGGEPFVNYGRCEVVRHQRPYNYVEPKPTDPLDPRLEDPAFRAEYHWVVEQIRATGCSCCHTPSAGVAPTSWNID